MQVDTELSAAANLLALIVASNARFSVVSEEGLLIESVTALDTPDADGNDTTAVVVAYGYAGTESFSYQRLALTNVVPASPPVVTVLTGDGEAEILAAVALAVGLIADELELVNAADAVEGGGFAIIDASPSSPIYHAGPLTVALDWQPASIQSLLDNTSIGGFDPPEDAG